MFSTATKDFQIAYEEEILCLFTVTFWENVDFHIIDMINTRDFTIHGKRWLNH